MEDIHSNYFGGKLCSQQIYIYIYIGVLYIGNLKTFGDFGPRGPPICEEENTFRRTWNMFMQRIVLGTTIRQAGMGSNMFMQRVFYHL